MKKILYSCTMGRLMFAMVRTRSSLAYSKSLVSRFMSNPGKEHWDGVKWIIRFLKDTSDYGLVYNKNIC